MSFVYIIQQEFVFPSMFRVAFLTICRFISVRLLSLQLPLLWALSTSPHRNIGALCADILPQDSKGDTISWQEFVSVLGKNMAQS